jgi:hypothetical protein
MYLNAVFITSAIILSLLITSVTLTNPAMASTKVSKGRGGGSVTQEQVNTGNPILDKEINQFYSCISKAHQDPPTIEKVDSCYYQTMGGISSSSSSSSSSSASIASNYGLAGAGTSLKSTTSSTSTSQHHKR